MSSAPLSLIVFDVDGTLLDSRALILAAMERAFAAADRPAPAPEAVCEIIGLSLEEALRRLAPEAEAPEIAALCRGYRDAFLAARAQTGGEAAVPLFPGARDALTRLSARPETFLGIATGKARRGLDHALQAHDIAEFFHTLQTADQHPSKPHPAMLAAALAETGTDPARAVMIGDTEFDVAMAKAAGLKAVGVAWGHHPPARLGAAGADAVIESFEALDATLAGFGLHA